MAPEAEIYTVQLVSPLTLSTKIMLFLKIEYIFENLMKNKGKSVKV